MPFTTVFLPSTKILAPCDSASVIYFSIRSFAALEITEPKFTPGITLRASSQICFIIWSTGPTATIADAAIQRCPAQPLILAVTLLAVIAVCASGITIK